MPLGDVGLPTTFGPRRPHTFASCSVPAATSRHLLGSPPPATSPNSCGPPRSARRRQLRPGPPRQCGLPPSQASALRHPVLSIQLSPPLHGPPTACFAPPPSAPSEPSALHASLPTAPVPTMTTLIVDALSSSVHRSSTPCLAPTSPLPLGSSPPATSPRQRVGDDDHGAPASPRRPLHVEPVGRVASRPDCLPSPPWRLALLVAFGDVALAHAVGLSDSRRRHGRSLVDLAGAPPPVTSFRTSPSCTVQSTVTASARASRTALRTTAFSSLCTPRHSVAVAAPVRRVLRRPSPFACTLGLSFLTACRGFGSHTGRS